MIYHIQTYYPEAGLFMNTNHESDDLEELKNLARSETFRGFRIRIVDDADTVVFEPAIQERKQDFTVSDIANMLGVPIGDPPVDLFGIEEHDDT